MSTRTFLSMLAIAALALALGWWLGGRAAGPSHAGPAAEAPDAGAGACPDGAEPAYWQAPMDPTYVRTSPGKSPMGMDLVPVCPGAAGSAKSGTVEVDPATVQSIGVRTARVERRDLVREVRAVGRVAWDERRVVHVHTKVQGWVERLQVDYLGQEVRRGQPLLDIYSPELVATQEELLLAARYREATRESPFGDVAGGGASLFEATRRRLELWDISPRAVDRLLETGEVERTLTLHAPTSGVVTELGVRSGMEVGPNLNLYTIADLSSVWVIADVYEFELPWLALGQTGRAELGSLPGESFSGPVTFIAPFLDPKTRTARVRIELPNPDGRLKPEMFGNVVIESEPRRDVVTIPSEAVLRSGRRTVVIVERGAGRFEPREIELGLESSDGFSEVQSGLEPGERVVVSSQFLIDSESNLQEAIQKLLADSKHEAAPPEPAPPAMNHGEYMHVPADPAPDPGMKHGEHMPPSEDPAPAGALDHSHQGPPKAED